ncbi:MAG: TIR domain-containing protein [Leptolyngbya sp. SIO3F4]|nr:TIR domain-containing protein [Leptolyngbya sp. SIO3F4]
MPKILILGANPNGTTRLRLDKEVRDISDGLERARRRDEFELAQRWAVRPRDLQRAMLDEKPQIVHFSGHGEGEAGLYFEDNVGNAQLVTGEALAGLFRLFKAQLKCVVLNGCYSEAQAEAISEHIPHVIGMRDGVQDAAAIEFAVGFYDALGAGESVAFAFELGKSAMALSGAGDEDLPVLLQGRVTDQSNVVSTQTSTQTNQSAQSTTPAARLDPNQPLNVFISYSHRDEELKEELEVHLSTLKRQDKIKPWQDRSIEAGKKWDKEIKKALENAQIILLLVTPRFMASDYINDIELTHAMKRHEAGTARVIPIILKPVDMKGTPLSDLQALPKDAKPVTRWDDQDEAFLDVVKGIRRVVDSLTANP